jgi:hypothetical protein
MFFNLNCENSVRIPYTGWRYLIPRDYRMNKYLLLSWNKFKVLVPET